MSGGRLNADVEQYRQAAAMNTPPPQIASDPLVAGTTPVEQLLRVLGLAANLGDSQDNATTAEQHAERDAEALDAAEKFAAQDEQAAAELNSIGAESYIATDGMAAQPEQAMAQQLPQMAAGIAGALAGAVGGAFQPLTQIPQQIAQGLQEAMQAGTGLFEQAGGIGAVPLDDTTLAEAPLDEDSGAFDDLGGLEAAAGAGGDLDSGLGAGGGGGLGSAGGDTAPMGYLGPPPVPSASTAPASAPVPSPAPAAPTPAGAAGTPGMAGMPMVPPGAMTGTPGTDKDPKADTKRVSVPTVRNGAPVQGRLTVPPTLPPMVRKNEPAPVVTRRIATPVDNQPGDAKSGS